MATGEGNGSKRPKDLRRYSCKTCGITRLKCIFLKLHIISSHGREALENDERFASEAKGQNYRRSPCVCQVCGVSFNKCAHLEQHKLSHTGQVDKGKIVDEAIDYIKTQPNNQNWNNIIVEGLRSQYFESIGHHNH